MAFMLFVFGAIKISWRRTAANPIDLKIYFQSHLNIWHTSLLPSFRFYFLLSPTWIAFKHTKGFSVGDELGFPESLGNVEGSKRRALNLRTGANSVGVLPAAKMPVRIKSPLHMHH